MNRQPRVLLGVCGGIAAYKAAELVRELQRRGMEVRVVMTRAAEGFIQPLTFASLTGHKVFTGMWADGANAAEIEHIAQAQWADLFLVAPATAHTIARFAHGLADDFLTCTYLATTAPVLLAPAMNVNMLQHEATQQNLRTLQARGNRIVDSGEGYLACGMTGGGRLAEIDEIVRAAEAMLYAVKDLAGETVFVTAGGTRESIDAVRFLGNRSSGKMGYAIAQAAQQRGARVVLISAPTALPTPAGCERIDVTTAAEMQTAVLQRLPEATVVIKAAAVADFRARAQTAGKLERSASLTLELEPTEDIARAVAERRKPGTLLIAFAAEAGLNVERARRKLRAKGADAIVVNDIMQEGTGFDADRNAAVILTESDAIDLPEASKTELAGRILDRVVQLRVSHALVS